MSSPLRLGIVGCGAIAATGHLPACAGSPQVQVVALADTDRRAAEALAREHGTAQAAGDYRDLAGKVEAVILATPPHVHTEQAAFFLERGIHVLCEKPMAPSAAACRELVEAASQNPGVRLAVGHVRRFFHYAEQMRGMVAAGELGEVLEVRADEGYAYNWPARTAHAFQRQTAPGGVVFDLGIHLLDQCVWMLGPVAELRYADDALGGIESNAEIHLTFACGATGHIRVSRTCERANRLAVIGTRGWAQASIYEPGVVAVGQNGAQGTARVLARPQTIRDALAEQLADFAAAIAGERAPRTTGEDGLRAVQMVERCYEQAQSRAVPALAPLPGVVRWS